MWSVCVLGRGKSAGKGLRQTFGIAQSGGCALTPCQAEVPPPDPTGDGMGDVGTNCPVLQLGFDKSLLFFKESAGALIASELMELC